MGFLFGKVGLYLGLAAVCLVALAVISRNWSCRQERGDREPRIERRGPFTVVSVDSGASLTIARGLRDRKRAPVILVNIVPCLPFLAPELMEEGRLHLETMAGKEIWVEVEDQLLRREELTGLVYGEGGLCLQVEQLRMGYAMIDSVAEEAGDVPESFKAAQAEAVKAKRGMWSEAYYKGE